MHGDVEAIRETHNAHMTHADEAWMSADSNLSQCSVMSSEQRTVQARSETLTARKRDKRQRSFNS